MLNVIFQADDFFLNIAAIDQQRRFLHGTLPVGVGAQQFLQARLQFFDVALQHRAPVNLHSLHGFAQMCHALA